MTPVFLLACVLWLIVVAVVWALVYAHGERG